MSLLTSLWKPLLLAALVVAALLIVRNMVDDIERLNATIAEKTDELTKANSEIDAQNQAIEKLRAAGKEQQDTIEGLAKEAQAQAAQVEVQWKTKYVPTPIPSDCPAAVATGARNAASVARLFITQVSP